MQGLYAIYYDTIPVFQTALDQDIGTDGLAFLDPHLYCPELRTLLSGGIGPVLFGWLTALLVSFLITRLRSFSGSRIRIAVYNRVFGQVYEIFTHLLDDGP